MIYLISDREFYFALFFWPILTVQLIFFSEYSWNSIISSMRMDLFQGSAIVYRFVMVWGESNSRSLEKALVNLKRYLLCLWLKYMVTILVNI